jgi:hypothetical protein
MKLLAENAISMHVFKVLRLLVVMGNEVGFH